ncbi:PAS domain-containing protein [Halosimplex salinum]|uniref:PAS domain-containing protein n=1 Tax=Halosimplex salinum TaxID=1710538 RepID=UPI000F4770B0|nr:PAS domain-containing protein [Halosimplex salinum]
MISAPLVGGPILAVVAAAFAWVAWRLRGALDRPGGTGLVGVVALLAVVTLAEALVVGLDRQPALLNPLTQIAVLGGAIGWTAFVVAYTGRDAGSGLIVVLVMAVPAVGLVGAVGRLTPILPVNPPLEAVGPLFLFLTGAPTTAAWGILVGLSLLLIWDATRYASFERTRGIALSLIGIALGAAPLVTSTLETGGAMSVGTGAVVTQVVILTAVVVGVGVGRPYRSLPIAEAIGRDVVVSNLNDAVVVVDADARIVDVNESAEELFGRTHGAVAGEPLTALFDAEDLDPSGLPAERTTVIEGPTGKRHFDVSVSRVRREENAHAGYAVALRDVTDERIRRQRLEVLHRVLRHNVRNDMTAVYGMANAVDDAGEERIAGRLRETADSLVDVTEQALAVEASMGIDPVADEPADAAGLAAEVVAELEREGHDVSITVEGECSVRRSDELVATVCEHLLSYATANADAPVRTRVEREGDYVVLTVEADDRFVHDEDVLAVEIGRETQLEHANDLDIWAVSWGVDRLGGELLVDHDEGTCVGIRIPVE